MRLVLFASLLLLLCGCQSDTKQQLHLFVWSEYFSGDVIKQFENEFNCEVILDTYDSNEAMYTKLRLGASGYDLIMPSNYIYQTMQEQGMLRIINLDQIKNLGNINQDELDRYGIKNLSFGIPYLMSFTGIGYIPSRVKEFVPTWNIFSRTDLRGRMTMLKDMREALGAALITLGYDINTQSAQELEQAVELLLNWRTNIAKYESEQYKNGLANLEFLVVQAYNNDVLQVMSENPKADFSWPQEGAVASIDLLAIPINAQNPELAELFIDFCLRKDIAIKTVQTTYSTCLVKFPREELNFDEHVLSILYPSDDKAQKIQLIQNVGEALPLYSEAWERVLSGG